jgi:hypothetical protein
MDLPFTFEQFLGVFITYNTSVWPVQIALNALALVGVYLCFRSSPPSRIIAAILAFLWLWTGVVYHLIFFSAVNPAARIFGTLCILQAAVFAFVGALRAGISFRFQWNIHGYAGAVLIVYGLIVYPILGYFLGHAYPASPTFGAPCPTTIFTFGLLLWTDNKVKFLVIVIPLLWSLVGFTAAISLGIMEDTGLLLAGVTGAILLTLKKDVARTGVV